MAGAIRNRFAALDGLRGVAAILVLVYHFQVLGHFQRIAGYLAVDLFFGLSGFVLASVYERRFDGGMTFWDFAKVRFWRLYPLMLLGAAIGLVAATVAHKVGLPALALAQLFWVPLIFGSGDLYPLNNVHWSLAFEAFANALHALVLRRLSTRALLAVAAVSAVALFIAARQFHYVSGGWDAETWWVGLPRVGFNYTLGVALYRLKRDDRLPKFTMPLPLIFALLVVGLSFQPWHDLHHAGDFLVVVVLLPTILLAGINAAAGPRVAQACTWIGQLSFPLYAVHYPILTLWSLYGLPFRGLGGVALIVVVVAATLAANALDSLRPRARLLQA